MSSITFKNPPLGEVVVGVEFVPLQLKAIHQGLYWAEVKSRFPKSEEQPVIARNKDEISYLQQAISRGVLPSARRMWLISEKEDFLVQLQANRFLYNWRKRPGSEYPRFKKISENFIVELKAFSEWCKNELNEEIQVKSYEVTYINHITPNLGWSDPKDTAMLFNILNDKWFRSGNYKPIGTAFNLEYHIPDLPGDLSISFKHGTLNSESEGVSPVLVAEFTIVGAISELDSLSKHLQNANDRIVGSFEGVLSEQAFKIFKRE